MTNGTSDASRDEGSAVVATGRGVVLTALSRDEQCVLAIPLTVASAEIGMRAALVRARTFGEVRQHPGAAALVDEWLPGYIEEQEDGEVDPIVRGEDDDAFDAEAFFGLDNQFVWMPDAASTTAQWLEDSEPDLADQYLQGDRGGLMDLEPCPFVEPERREALERDLAAYGYEVRQWPQLAELYSRGL